MSVSSTVARVTVLITALPQTIPVFQFLDASDLLVVDGGALNTGRNPATVLTYASDYTVTGGGYNNANQLLAGSVVIASGGAGAVLVGDYITITRNITLNQTVSFVATGPKTPLLVEQDDDNLTLIGQQINDAATRSMRAPVQENLDWVMPNAVTRAASFPFFDAAGNLTLYTLADITAAAAAGTGTVAAHRFYAGPASGSAAIPTFRAIVASDLTGLTGFALAGPVTTSNLTQTTGKLLGRTTGLTGAIEEITPGTSLSFSGGALNTVQDIRTTDSPTFARVTSQRSDGDYGFVVNSATRSFGHAVSGTTYLFESVTNADTIWAVDDSSVFYFSQLTTNGLLRTSAGNGGVTVAAFGQIPGTTTNDSAAAGDCGEYSTATQGSDQPLVSNTALNVITLSLTAGDWDVEGNVYFALAAATTATGFSAWVSTTSATSPGGTLQVSYFTIPVGAAAGNALSLVSPVVRISLSGTTTVYVSCASTFAVSTMTAKGSIRARRIR